MFLWRPKVPLYLTGYIVWTNPHEFGISYYIDVRFSRETSINYYFHQIYSTTWRHQTSESRKSCFRCRRLLRDSQHNVEPSRGEHVAEWSRQLGGVEWRLIGFWHSARRRGGNSRMTQWGISEWRRRLEWEMQRNVRHTFKRCSRVVTCRPSLLVHSNSNRNHKPSFDLLTPGSVVNDIYSLL